MFGGLFRRHWGRPSPAERDRAGLCHAEADRAYHLHLPNSTPDRFRRVSEHHDREDEDVITTTSLSRGLDFDPARMTTPDNVSRRSGHAHRVPSGDVGHLHAGLERRGGTDARVAVGVHEHDLVECGCWVGPSAWRDRSTRSRCAGFCGGRRRSARAFRRTIGAGRASCGARSATSHFGGCDRTSIACSKRSC